MIKQIKFAAVLSLVALQVACGKSKKEKEAMLTEHCDTQACVDMYKNAAKNAGIVGIPAAVGKPQIATPGAPVLPGQVPETAILPASVSDAEIASKQAKIKSALLAINPPAAAPVTSTSNLAPASVANVPNAATISVSRLPASQSSEIAPASQQPATFSNPSTYAPASVDNGPAVAADPESFGVGVGR